MAVTIIAILIVLVVVLVAGLAYSYKKETRGITLVGPQGMVGSVLEVPTDTTGFSTTAVAHWDATVRPDGFNWVVSYTDAGAGDVYVHTSARPYTTYDRTYKMDFLVNADGQVSMGSTGPPIDKSKPVVVAVRSALAEDLLVRSFVLA